MQLSPYIKAGFSVINIITPEESRAEGSILNTAKELKRNIRVWSVTEGYFVPGKDGEQEQVYDPIDALIRAKNESSKTLIIMRDLHQYFENKKLIRLVRDIARDFKQQAKTLIMLSPVKKIPPDLERDITVIEFELPKRDELELLFNTMYEGNKKNIGNISEDEKEKILQASLGLTTVEAESAFAKAFVEFAGGDKKETVSKLVMKEKANTVKKTGILEYFEAPEGINDIGGLENLKDWMQLRSKAFTKQAREYKLPSPRGIILAGSPGTGKSLCAKALSNILGLPLIKFDIGKVFGGLVGQSESQMRSALATIDAINNCVVFVDEVDKLFAGMTGGGSSDGGTSQRVFAQFLTYCQEKKSAAFIVMTLNRIEGLPPELTRKGRFDEIFFVGLPSAKEREQIFKIHVKKHGRDFEKMNSAKMKECVKLSDGFSGAEIGESVVSALFMAFSKDEELNADYILDAVKLTNPLSKSRAEEFKQMISWASANAINASKTEKAEKVVAAVGTRQLDI